MAQREATDEHWSTTAGLGQQCVRASYIILALNMPWRTTVTFTLAGLELYSIEPPVTMKSSH